MSDPRPGILVLAGPPARRALGLWIGCHALFAVVSLWAHALFPPDPPVRISLWPGVGEAVLLVLVLPLLFLIDLRVMRLRLFLANLGIPLGLVLFLVLVQAAGLELLAGSVRGFLLGGASLP